jgi:hypothetical protein
MRRLFGSVILATLIGGGLFISWSAPAAQTRPAAGGAISRTSDGKPDLNGIWQAMTTANWDLEDHSTRVPLVSAYGTVGAAPAGRSVVEGGEIPYKPEARKKQKENAANWVTLDPEVKCYLPGIPRAMYMPYPFQIVQNSQLVLMAFEFAVATRPVYLDKTPAPPIDTWMGHSVGRWEGDTLVIQTDTFNDLTWFDRAGNHHSDALKVTERITPMSRDALSYEATMTDPNTFTRPWKINLTLYRHLEPRAELMEFNCVELVEETLWGHLKKKTAAR